MRLHALLRRTVILGIALLAVSVAIGVSAQRPARAADKPAPDSVRVTAVPGIVETGLAKWLLEDFHAAYPQIRVDVTGASLADALEAARHGEADLLITNHRPTEEVFIADGWATGRTILMFGEYAFFGPPGDRLQLKPEIDARAVMRKIEEAKVPFVAPWTATSAGMRVSELWQLAGAKPDWSGYEVQNVDSDGALRAAAGNQAYSFGETASFMIHRKELQDALQPLTRVIPSLRNYFSIVQVSSDKVPGIRTALAEKFRDYLLSDRGQARIGAFTFKGTQSAIYWPAAHQDDGLRAQRADDDLWWTSITLYTVAGIALAALAGTWIGFSRVRRAGKTIGRHQRIEDRFSKAVEAGGFGIWDWHLSSDQVYLSGRFQEIVGLDMNGRWFPAPRELWDNILHPDDAAAIISAIEAALSAGNGSVDLEARLKPAHQADGTTLPTQRVRVRARAFPKRKTNGARIVGTLEELDDRQPPRE